MNWIRTNAKLPDTTRTVFASDGRVIGLANYSRHLKEWGNCTVILPGIENWLYADEIVLWAEVGDLHKTLPEVKDEN